LPCPDLLTRCEAAVRAAPRTTDLGGWLPAEEIDEVRLVGSYLTSADVAVLELPSDRVDHFVDRAVSA
jgi:hypothetical protein